MSSGKDDQQALMDAHMGQMIEDYSRYKQSLTKEGTMPRAKKTTKPKEPKVAVKPAKKPSNGVAPINMQEGYLPPLAWYPQAQAFIAVLKEAGFVPNMTPAQAVVLMMKGMAIGVDAFTALQQLKLLENGAVVFESAELMRAMIAKRGWSIIPTKMDVDECIVEGRRGGDIQQFSYTMEEARRSGIVGGAGWDRVPADMLFARASTRCGRAMFPDVISGMGYTPEELGVQEKPTQPKQPVKPQAVAAQAVPVSTAPEMPAAVVPPQLASKPDTVLENKETGKLKIQVLSPVTGKPELWETNGFTAAQADTMFGLLRQEGRVGYLKQWLADNTVERVRDLTHEQGETLVMFLHNPAAVEGDQIIKRERLDEQQPLTMEMAQANWIDVIDKLELTDQREVLEFSMGWHPKVMAAGGDIFCTPEVLMKAGDELGRMARTDPDSLRAGLVKAAGSMEAANAAKEAS